MVLRRIDQLAVVLKNSGAVDHQVRSGGVFRFMAKEDRNPHGAFQFQDIAFVIIGTGDMIPLTVENLYDREHPGTSYPDEMQIFLVL